MAVGLVVLARLADPMVAHLLQGLLEEEGIRARVVEERLGEHIPPVLRAAVEVLPEDLERARAVLDEVGPDAADEDPSDAPAPPPAPPRAVRVPSHAGPCPQCGSPHAKRRWFHRGHECTVCGERWA